MVSRSPRVPHHRNHSPTSTPHSILYGARSGTSEPPPDWRCPALPPFLHRDVHLQACERRDVLPVLHYPPRGRLLPAHQAAAAGPPTRPTGRVSRRWPPYLNFCIRTVLVPHRGPVPHPNIATPSTLSPTIQKSLGCLPPPNRGPLGRQRHDSHASAQPTAESPRVMPLRRPTRASVGRGRRRRTPPRPPPQPPLRPRPRPPARPPPWPAFSKACCVTPSRG
jgi:hypothetical protein